MVIRKMCHLVVITALTILLAGCKAEEHTLPESANETTAQIQTSQPTTADVKKEQKELDTTAESADELTDELTEGLKLVFPQAASTRGPRRCGGFWHVNPEKKLFEMVSQAGKGPATPIAIMNYDGEIIMEGYDSSLWMTKDGFVKMIYCEKGTELEAAPAQVFNIEMGRLDATVFLEIYDWDLNLLSRTELESEGPNWNSEVVALYPPDYEYHKVENVQITWQVDANGYTIYDVEGNELGYIAIEDAEDLQPMVQGDLLGFWSEKSDYYHRIYWVTGKQEEQEGE